MQVRLELQLRIPVVLPPPPSPFISFPALRTKWDGFQWLHPLAVSGRPLGYDGVVGLVDEHGRVVVQVHHAHLHHHVGNPAHVITQFVSWVKLDFQFCKMTRIPCSYLYPYRKNLFTHMCKTICIQYFVGKSQCCGAEIIYFLLQLRLHICPKFRLRLLPYIAT